MVVRYLPRFKKQYRNLSKPIQLQFDNRLRLFAGDRSNPLLSIHPLKGAFFGYWSLNVNGDVRVLYFAEGDDAIVFALIGTHSELYR